MTFIRAYMYPCIHTLYIVSIPVTVAVPIPVAVEVPVPKLIPPCPSLFGYSEDIEWSINCRLCNRADVYSKPGVCVQCDFLRIQWIHHFFLGHTGAPVLYAEETEY